MHLTLDDHNMPSNTLYQGLTIGQTVSIEKVLTQCEIILFAETSGDLNPLHLDSEYAVNTKFGQPIAHGIIDKQSKSKSRCKRRSHCHC